MLMAASTTGAYAQVTEFTSWVCVIDLEQALGADFTALGPLPREVRTTNSTKKCTGSNIPSENIQIDCIAELGDAWRGGQRVYQGVGCQIFQGQCGQPGFVTAQGGRLSINTSGTAMLSCARN
jgi:hypothetical protein